MNLGSLVVPGCAGAAAGAVCACGWGRAPPVGPALAGGLLGVVAGGGGAGRVAGIFLVLERGRAGRPGLGPGWRGPAGDRPPWDGGSWAGTARDGRAGRQFRAGRGPARGRVVVLGPGSEGGGRTTTDRAAVLPGWGRGQAEAELVIGEMEAEANLAGAGAEQPGPGHGAQAAADLAAVLGR